MQIEGYAYISKEANSGLTICDMNLFLGKIVRVLKFDSSTNSVVVIDKNSTGIAIFKNHDIQKYFKCEIFADVICDINMSLCAKFYYINKCHLRKEGYNAEIKQKIIEESLNSLKFNDSCLW